MRILVILPLVLSVVQANSSDKQDTKPKTTSPPLNTLPQGQKYETIYQPMKFYPQPVHQLQSFHQLQLQQQQQQQQKPQYVPIQIIPKYLVPQPHAMIIIAQPALLPQSLVYNNNNPMQQLLHYFHSNPHARYQLLQGNYQHPSVQQVQQTVQPATTYMHQVIGTHPLGNLILTPAPQYQQPFAPSNPIPTPVTHQQTAQVTAHQQSNSVGQLTPSTTHQQSTQANGQLTPTSHQQLGSLAQLAQLAAQQYVSSQMKIAPAIVTGFENFTPEQQAQIKAQLSAHLGPNFHAVSSTTANQYSSKYVAEQDKSDFVPSPQIKTEPATTTSTTGDILKTHRYVNTKN